MGQLRIYMKKVTATFMLMPGNSRLGSCVHFEVTLPKGKVLDITGDRLSDKEKAFESAFDKANSANILAQAAFNKANTGGGTSGSFVITFSPYSDYGWIGNPVVPVTYDYGSL